jgi:signal transduction histidine kinase
VTRARAGGRSQGAIVPDNAGMPETDRRRRLVLYRIAQEALTNIVKHAQASAVSIVLTRSSRAVAAVIVGAGTTIVAEVSLR